MRLSIQVDSGATPYSAKIPSVVELEGAVATTVAVGNSNCCGDPAAEEEASVDEEGEVAVAAEVDDCDEDGGDGADDAEVA